LLALPAEADWWSRLLAVPLFNFGILCIGIARTRSRPLIKLTVVVRLWVIVTLAILVAARLAPAIALTVGVIGCDHRIGAGRGGAPAGVTRSRRTKAAVKGAAFPVSAPTDHFAMQSEVSALHNFFAV